MSNTLRGDADHNKGPFTPRVMPLIKWGYTNDKGKVAKG